MKDIENIWYPTKVHSYLSRVKYQLSVLSSVTTDYFKVETGVQQGDIPSPFFFLVVMDYVMQKQ